MSILDAINEAEEKAEKIKENARIKARDIVSTAQIKARTQTDKTISQTREKYNRELESLQKEIDESATRL